MDHTSTGPTAAAIESLGLIPVPRQVTLGTGPAFRLTESTTLTAEPGAEDAAAVLRESFTGATGYQFPTAGDGAIRLRVSPTLPAGSYRCEVGADRIMLTAGSGSGLVAAVQTLQQLLPPEIYSATPSPGVPWSIPQVLVEDAPAFAWRGALLDVARWFRPLPELLRFVDLLAMHKCNVLHLHLTDDQGWRMPSERYPLLTEVGGWREQTRVGHENASTAFDGTRHGGCYTAAELRKLVRYAQLRGVTVLPEIDLPGHTQSAIAAYPWLGNRPDLSLPVMQNWGISENVLNLDDATLQFCRDVLDEVMDVFPSRLVHIGGDECPKVQWCSSFDAQRRMHELGLTDENQLQSWFTAQLSEHVRSRGRNIIGWDEIVEGGLVEGATVMSWRGEAGGIAAARAGHDVVMTPENRTYFDHYQHDPDREPLAIGGLTTLDSVYAYRPVPAELADVSERVLGTQGQLWGEYLPTSADVDRMAFPRMCALAEVAWGTAADFGGFTRRLAGRHLGRLQAMGVAVGD